MEENIKWIICIDASENYWGATLYFEDSKGIERITRYASGKFKE